MFTVSACAIEYIRLLLPVWLFFISVSDILNIISPQSLAMKQFYILVAKTGIYTITYSRFNNIRYPYIGLIIDSIKFISFSDRSCFLYSSSLVQDLWKY